MATNQKGRKIPFRLETEIPPYRSLWIGVLQGTWREMGMQYGQRAGKDIARNFDIWWRNNVLADRLEWQKGRAEGEKTEYANAYFQRSLKEFSCLCPELVEFFEGIALGAAKPLDGCVYGGIAPHTLKVAMLNTPWAHLHPDWDFGNDSPRAATADRIYAGSSGDDCNGLWVKGNATKTGDSYATRTSQSTYVMAGGSGRERQVAYVAVPTDPNARVFWGNGRAGNLGGLGGGLLNDAGVCVLTSGAQNEVSDGVPDETLAPGVVDFWRASYGVIFSDSAGEASERVTAGTERYRQLTGRKTVMKNRGCNIVFADPKEAFVVEQNARHYNVRMPGDLGEKGADYVVHANHFKGDGGSFDEGNVFRPVESMAGYCPEKKGISSYYRFWSGMWMLHNSYGDIDIEMMTREIAPAHIAYDRAGKRYEPDPDTGAPTVPGTWCTHEGERTAEDPKGKYGDVETSVFNLSTLEVRWVPIMPCHYREWDLDWHYTDLKPYREYRKTFS